MKALRLEETPTIKPDVVITTEVDPKVLEVFDWLNENDYLTENIEVMLNEFLKK